MNGKRKWNGDGVSASVHEENREYLAALTDFTSSHQSMLLCHARSNWSASSVPSAENSPRNRSRSNISIFFSFVLFACAAVLLRGEDASLAPCCIGLQSITGAGF